MRTLLIKIARVTLLAEIFGEQHNYEFKGGISFSVLPIDGWGRRVDASWRIS